MCGIIGYVGDRDASFILVQGLKRLEYRGYDSAGVATFHDGQITVRRALGKLGEPGEPPARGSDHRARSGSATRAGRPTAGRRSRTRIRTAPDASSSSTTASSRTTSSCARRCRRAAGASAPRPTPRSSRT